MQSRYFLGVHEGGKLFLSSDAKQVAESAVEDNGVNWFGVEVVENKPPKITQVEIKASPEPIPETEIVNVEIGGVIVGVVERFTEAEKTRQENKRLAEIEAAEAKAEKEAVDRAAEKAAAEAHENEAPE